MIGLAIDFETNGFHGSSVLSVAAIKFKVDWYQKSIQKVETFIRHYYPVEKWNYRAIKVNGLSSTRIDALRTGATYPVHFRDDQEFQSFANDVQFAVAHNAKFDSRFANIQVPWICTMQICGGKLAEAATAKGIIVNHDALHQAEYDTEICLALFEHLLRHDEVRCPC